MMFTPEHGIDIMSIYRAFHGLHDLKKLQANVEKFFSKIGVERFNFVLLSPHIGYGNNIGDGIKWFWNNYDSEWLAEYRAKHYAEADPVNFAFPFRRMPYTWSETLFDMSIRRNGGVVDGGVETFVRRVVDCNLNHGMAIPVSTSFGDIAGFYIVVDKNDSCSSEIAMYFKVICSVIYDAFWDIIVKTPKAVTRGNVSTDLTNREKEILHWVVHGKVNADIAEIIGISKFTVDFHLRSIFNKLRVNTRSQAVVVALQHGLVKYHRSFQKYGTEIHSV